MRGRFGQDVWKSQFGVPFAGFGSALFTPSVYANPPRRVPQRVEALLAMAKALEAVALAPGVSRPTAVSAMQSFYSVSTPLLQQAPAAYRADYIFVLWGAGEPKITKAWAETAGSIVANWLNRVDKVLALAPSGWERYLAGVEADAVDLLRGALEFQANVAEVVGEMAKKAGQSLFDLVPWWVWALGVVAVAGPSFIRRSR